MLGFIDIIAENLLIAGVAVIAALAFAWDHVRLFLLRLLGDRDERPCPPPTPAPCPAPRPSVTHDDEDALFGPTAISSLPPKQVQPAASVTNQLLSGLRDSEPGYLSDSAAFDLAIESLAYAVDYFRAIGNEEGEQLARQAAQAAFKQHGEQGEAAPVTKGAKK